MDVHDSPGTTNDSKDQDHCLLSSSTRFKRVSALPPEAKQYETIRKINHVQEQATTDRKPTESIDPQSQQIFQISSFQGGPKYSQSICSTPLRQKYAHLLPEYQSAQYNLQQKTLMRIQARLDQHLMYLKTHRGRKHGQFFKIIRRNLIEGVQLIFQLNHLKKIMFLDSKLYICNYQRSRDLTFDILIDIPMNSDIPSRKASFRQKLFQYLRQNGAFATGRKNTLQIPMIKFNFEEKIQSSNQVIVNKRIEISNQQSQKLRQMQKEKVSLKNMINKTSSTYKDMLYQKIQERENRLLEQAKTIQVRRRFGKEEVLKVIDQILLIYSSKKICNMFLATLTDQLAKQLAICQNVLVEIVELILQNCSIFLRKVEHQRGAILQMDRKAYTQARNAVQLLDI